MALEIRPSDSLNVPSFATRSGTVTVLMLAAGLATKQNADPDLADIADASATNDDILQRKSGAWTPRTLAQITVDLSSHLWTAFGGLVAGGADKATPVDADTFAIADSAASSASKKLTWANVKATMWAALGALIAGGTAKATPVDADTFALSDSAAANASKKVTWANLKATIWAAWGVLIATGTEETIPADGDSIGFSDVSAAGATKKITLANLRAWYHANPIFTGITDFAGEVQLDPRMANMESLVRRETTGEILYGWDHGRFRYPTQPLSKQGRNSAFTQGLLTRGVTHLAYPIVGYNAIVEYGQSKANGSEGWPAKSTTNVDSNKMLGVSPFSAGASVYAPPGGVLVFNDLVAATVDSSHLPMSDVAVAALAPGSTNRGETPGVGAANFFKQAMNRRARVASDTTRLLAYFCAAEGGLSMDELRKTHTVGAVEWYGRYFDFLTDFSTAAAAAGSSPRQVLAILWGQGENEMVQADCSSTNRAEFRALLQAGIVDAMQADALALGGNTRIPGFFAFAPGDNYTQDVDGNGDPDLFVQMAFLEHSWETKSFFLIGPHYPYTDKNSLHLDANGYRWAGLKAGMVMDHVINQGRHWEPLAPIEIECTGEYLWIHYHVPVPPLRTGISYRDGNAIDLATRGYRVSDVVGNVDIDGVDIYPTMVRLRLSRVPLPGGLVWYADKSGYTPISHLGHGNIRDSETADPNFLYQYLLDSGDYASANIAALVNHPYDMSNWGVPFCLPMNWRRTGV